MALLGALVLLAAAQGPDPSRLLAEAVDAATPAERAKAAAALAAKKDVNLDAWLAAAKGFGAFVKAEPGVVKETVPLWNGEASSPYEVYVQVPKGYDPSKPAPLMLALHGAGGAGDEVHPWWREVSDELGMVVVAPSDPAAKEGYTFTPKERQAGLSAVRWARRRFNIDENRIYASGFSRGGHMVWDLTLRNPDLFAAIAPMIGGPWAVVAGDRNNLRYLETLTSLPIRDLQGSKDDAKLVSDLRYCFKRLKSFGAKNAELIEFPELGHAFEFGKVKWTEFLTARRNPVPKTALAMTAGRPPAGHTSGRAYFAEILGVKSNVVEDVKMKVTKQQWDAMDDDRRRQWMNEQAEKATARLEATWTAPGQFTVKSSGVTKARLLCTAEMIDPKQPAAVNHNGKTLKHAVKLDAAVLLAEFAERFDRTFLPVFEIKLESP